MPIYDKGELHNANKTLSYYNKNSSCTFEKETSFVFSTKSCAFLSYMSVDSLILDFGCGSGRDTKYFLEKGYKVEAIDGSAELCRLASEYTGIKVKRMLFSELSADSLYDGIWACSSILHLSKEELRVVLHKMMKATKDNGYIYTSFKYGEFEGYRNERYFTDFTEDSFETFIKDVPGLKMIECWISEDVCPGRGEEKWLNLILQKLDTA